jgi:hypothetical protein
MSVRPVGAPVSVAARRPIGLYAVIAYSVSIAIQLPLAQQSTIPVGRYTLEGAAAQFAVVVWSAAWIVTVIGLFLMRRWGYRLGQAIFVLFILLVGSNTLTWLANNNAPASIALKIAVWPVLPWLIVDVLVIAYLYARRGIFARPAEA